MRLFIYEHISAGGSGPEAPASLRAEGWAMLQAIAADFAQAFPGIHVTTLVDDRCPDAFGHDCRHVADGCALHAFSACAAQADATLVIAPEFFHLLLDRSARVLAGGRRLLGALPSAIQLAGDKQALARHWQDRGVPTPATTLAGLSPPPLTGPPWVCKPRHGAGSQATSLIRDRADWRAAFARLREEWPTGDLLAQAYIPGQAASVAFLLGPGRCVPLLPASQILSDEGRFQYRGGRVPLPAPLYDRAVRLARRALQGIDGLQGYVGVDLVLGAADDGSDDHAIEINPRLTTSYLGLRQLCRANLAQAWLDVLQSKIVDLPWRPGVLEFAAAAKFQFRRFRKGESR